MTQLPLLGPFPFRFTLSGQDSATRPWDGVPAGEAVAFVRQHYDARAVETPWQRRFVVRFGEE